MSGARRLPMVQRLGLLAAFNVAVYVAYIQIIEELSTVGMTKLKTPLEVLVSAQRSKQRGGSFSKDGYDYWSMFREPKHLREQKEKASDGNNAQN